MLHELFLCSVSSAVTRFRIYLLTSSDQRSPIPYVPTSYWRFPTVLHHARMTKYFPDSDIKMMSLESRARIDIRGYRTVRAIECIPLFAQSANDLSGCILRPIPEQSICRKSPSHRDQQWPDFLLTGDGVDHSCSWVQPINNWQGKGPIKHVEPAKLPP